VVKSTFCGNADCELFLVETPREVEARGRSGLATPAFGAPSDARENTSIEPRPRAALPAHLLVAIAAVLLVGCTPVRPPAPPRPTPTPAPAPTPTPHPPLTCVDPGEAVEEEVGAWPTLTVTVDRAVARVRVTHPELFAGDRLAGWPSDGQLQETVFRRFALALVDALAEWRYCALAWQDAVAVQAIDGKLEEYHVVGFAEGRIGTGGNTFKHTWRPTAGPSIPPTPLPPTPGPVPPSPSPGACPLQLPLSGYEVGLRIGTHGTSGQQWDATPFIAGPSSTIPPRGWTGACRTQQCDLSPEKDPEHGAVCTVQLCGAAVEYSLFPADAGFINWVQGYTVKLTLSRAATLTGRCPVSGVVASVAVP
jgi:hypothetical protein